MPSESESSAPAALETPRVFCKKCGYALVGLASRQCPECGRGFDLKDPRTFARRPPRGWVWRWGRRLLVLTLLLLLAAGAGLLWLWWGWQAEQKTIARLRMFQQDFTVRPIGPQRLRGLLGERLGYLTDRVYWAALAGWKAAETEPLDFRPLAHLQHLILLNCEVRNSDLSSLAGLEKLEALYLYYPNIENPDLAFLDQLPALSNLSLRGTRISNGGFRHLNALKRLKQLNLEGTGMTNTDLRHLEGLSSLEQLNLFGNPISNAGLEHLRGLRSLRVLVIDQQTMDPLGIAKLKQAIPGLQVKGY